jgi:hypothetical protein
MLILVHMFLSLLDVSLTWVSGHLCRFFFFFFFNASPIYIYIDGN